jgi:2-amino-4-hydroxy-6-hydroxymethyldihydropteridine diphosphokinase
MTPDMTSAIGYVALGSNVGDRRANLDLGLAGMADLEPAPTRRSSVWETEPVGTAAPRDVPWFLNRVIQIRTTRPPFEVLEVLLEIERAAGRVPSPRNAPRTLDLDLLVLGDARIRDSRLTLPHPRMWSRRFVLAPLAEIDPALRNPDTGKSVEETLGGLSVLPEVRRLGEVAAFAAGPVYSSTRSIP